MKRVKLLAALLCVSFALAVLTVWSMNVVFWISMAVFAAVSGYISRHQKELEAELDELFGRSDRMR